MGGKPKSRDGQLRGEGWLRQFSIEEPRLSEFVNLYKSLGMEVHLEPMTPSESPEECQACFLSQCDKYKTIYTRPKRQG
ncbi:MAG: hypothetical protein HYU86_04405 [Chloroflexi bacterium]|nr:hypothetical protein [Chloroflexota bacterium]